MRNAYLQLCDYGSRFRILKGGKISLVVSAFIASTTLLHSAPLGGVVTSGNANIIQSGTTTTIHQSTNKASINWNTFSIGSSETVNFNQPNVSSITLNRIVGNEKSVIDGALNANGQVWILNSNGVLFGKNASINTSGLLATTQSLSDADFQAGNYSFKGDSTASVINLGTIDINNGGYASLLANSVSNEGTIKAIKGTITLTGANEATINLNGNSLVNLKVDKGVLDALVENKGAIIADGGKIYLTTNAANELLKGVVNNTGVIEANYLDDITGTVELYAHGGTTNLTGTIEANEGFVETSGEALHVKDGTRIKAKEWLIDPVNVTIDAALATTLEGQLALGDATITTTSAGSDTGDITVNSDITWATTSQLTLHADNAIYVNATIANTNTTNGGVYFNAANTTNKVVFGANGKVMVYNPYQLQWINTALAGKYALGANIDASGTPWNSGAGFVPIGDDTNQFTGTLDGKGYTIDNLMINRLYTDNVGLFGVIGPSSTIKNIGLSDVTITGSNKVGGLVGYNNGGTIANVYATGSVHGNLNTVGGLVGYNSSGTLSNVYAIVNVHGNNTVGGLVGSNKGTITNAYAAGGVNGSGTLIGGLIGYNFGTISNSYWDIDTSGKTTGIELNQGSATLTGIYSSTSTINAFTQATYTGFDFSNTGAWYMIEGSTRPFLRSEYSTTITNDHQLQLMAMNLSASYTLSNNITYANDGMWSSTGFVPIGDSTNNFTGTLDGKGYVIDSLTINRSSSDNVGLIGYAGTGAVIENIGLTNVNIMGHNYVGGLVGYNNYGTISDTYATGSVSGTTNTVGGLVGLNYQGTITDSYAMASVNGPFQVGGLVGINYGTITDSYATGSVSGTNLVGGLVGYNYHGTITNAYATGGVSGTNDVGGLVGYNDTGTIIASFWNTETSGQSSSSGGTGKTTAELQLFSTFADVGWDIINGTSATPSLSMGGTHAWTMLPETVSYTLSTINLGYTYSGNAVNLSSLWSAITLFGSNHASWVYGTDYVFLDTNSNVVTSYTNAGTYSNLYVDILKNGYTEASSGNTKGSLTIAKANATVTANSDTKTYNGLTQSISGFHATGLVNSETESVLSGVTTTGGSGTNAGEYTLTASGVDGNYNLTFVDGKLTITKANATVTANSGSLVYNGLSQSLGFGATGLVNGETKSVLSGVTAIGGTDVGEHTISLNGVDTNYNLTFVNGSLTITPASLTVTANNASKTKDGLAYSGGNGVSYSGFVNHETASVLGGALSYGGTAQGATTEGTYVIKPMGLSSGNYTLSYVDGVLMITLAPTVSISHEPNIAYIENGVAVRPPFFNEPTRTLEIPSNNTPSELVRLEVLQGMLHTASSGDTRVPLWSNSLIQLVNGGVHLPDGVEQQFFMAQR
ncbi:beta strand repeat-containing protein [Sulfurospirillum diekertiae]|uniref:beta strand repeat-containing protein n=1 Tax=Sulfurospirillum diekertiae TaxID=1854492 RepID=UPI000B4D9EF6|nr:GLUG motif-containing protein [Sulfurospirillum diekertiae]ASC93488.1 Heme/hemopexin-binding protein [Sulfurospirillum diekertiae]